MIFAICSVGLSTLFFGEHHFLSFVFDWESKVIQLLVFGLKPMKSVLVVFVPVGRWLVGFPSSGWWKVMPSSTSSSAKASYQLLNVGLSSDLQLVRRLESGCRPAAWRLFVIIGVWILRWWWSRRCWSAVVVVIFWLSRCAPNVLSGETWLV